MWDTFYFALYIAFLYSQDKKSWKGLPKVSCFIRKYCTLSTWCGVPLEKLFVHQVQVTQKKRELLKTPTKIEEIQEKKFIGRNW